MRDMFHASLTPKDRALVQPFKVPVVSSAFLLLYPFFQIVYPSVSDAEKHCSRVQDLAFDNLIHNDLFINYDQSVVIGIGSFVPFWLFTSRHFVSMPHYHSTPEQLMIHANVRNQFSHCLF
jgi:hypothetical protein